jgi:hypothetical protein
MTSLTKQLGVNEMTDIIIRFVADYGYLPIITVDGKEVYRGEFKKTAQEAFDRAFAMKDKVQ